MRQNVYDGSDEDESCSRKNEDDRELRTEVRENVEGHPLNGLR